MANFLFLLMLVLSVEVAVCVTTPKAYWETHLPNTPMPMVLQATSPKSQGFNYKGARAKFNSWATMALYSWYNYQSETPEYQMKEELLTSIFLRPEDLKPDHIVEVKFMGASKLGPPFMPRSLVEKTLPFSSKDMPNILAAFSIKPKSQEAQKMRATLRLCEGHREDHRCLSSLESMVDYVSSQMKVDSTSKAKLAFVKPMSVNVLPWMETKRSYVIKRVEMLPGDKTLSCHKGSFPYGVFYCHRLSSHATPYHVELESVDKLDNGKKLRVSTALVSCHHDTSSWNPYYAGFTVLNTKPGAPVCHFLHADNVMYVGV